MRVVDLLLREGFPANAGLFEMNFFMFKPARDTGGLFEAWWQLFETFGNRDQLLLPYALSKHPLPIHPLFPDGVSVRNIDAIAYHPHGSTIKASRPRTASTIGRPPMNASPLLLPIRVIYRRLPLPARAWLRTRAASLSAWAMYKLFPANYLALDAHIGRRVETRVPSPGSVPTPLVDMTIVTFNSAKWLDRLFRSLAEQKYPLSRLAILVVDNGSGDNTVALLDAWRQRLQDQVRRFAICMRPNHGYGAGQNAAIAMGDAEYVLIANPDIEFTPDSLMVVTAQAACDPPQRGQLGIPSEAV